MVAAVEELIPNLLLLCGKERDPTLFAKRKCIWFEACILEQINIVLTSTTVSLFFTQTKHCFNSTHYLEIVELTTSQ